MVFNSNYEATASMLIMITKICTKCKKSLPSIKFSKHKKSKNKLDSWCKQCHTKSNLKWQEAHKDKVKLSKQRWQQTNKSILNERRKLLWQANRTEMLKKSRQYYETNRDKTGLQGLHYRYGITPEDYSNLLKLQNNACAICEQLETASYKGRIRRLSVDHCHKTNKVRGLLCSNCNFLIGLAKESKDILLKAIKYLELRAII